MSTDNNKDLIIVESPAKVNTIKKFLGNNFMVEASVGHIRDLPTKELGVDEENGFTPVYQISSGKNSVVQKLKKLAEQSNTVYLAPDPDREGEAIAWHVAKLIQDKNPNIKRIQFNEITSGAVKQALESPRGLDERLFYSQQARRILDRLVGYKISPLLWQKVKRGISAGRVQSVALRLIVEREKERLNFEPQEYWIFKSQLQAGEQEEFESELWKLDGKKAHIGSGEEAQALEEEVRQCSFYVHKVEEKQKNRQPKPPFITSSLQQEASNRFNFSAKKTMTLAQTLYEGVDLKSRGTTALITYMRTDSVRVSKEAQDAAKDWIVQNMGKDYHPGKPRNFKSKNTAQDAHEAIRPVDVFITPAEVKKVLSNDLYKLYNLIWTRFVASQMAPAKVWDSTVTVKAGRTEWRAKGSRLIFPGFLSIYSPEESLKEVKLPELSENQELALKKLSKEQKFTQPPARFTEASLVRKLEEKGIGRPSTYAQILSTIRDREYVRMEKKQFVPTELGYTVNDMLVNHFSSLVDVGFTADMEKNLDKIADGELNWQQLLHDFSEDFYPTLEKAQKNMSQVKGGMETDITCEKCGKPMLIKFGKNGEFLACSGYPECNNTTDFLRDENGKLQVIEKKPQNLQKMGTCPKCGADMVLKKAKTGNRFIACSNFPDCKHAMSYGTGVPCPNEGCEGELVEKSTKGKKVFYACNQYPDCKYAVWNFPVQESCPQCNSPILLWKSTKSRGEHLACPEKECKYWREIEQEVSTEDSD